MTLHKLIGKALAALLLGGVSVRPDDEAAPPNSSTCRRTELPANHSEADPVRHRKVCQFSQRPSGTVTRRACRDCRRTVHDAASGLCISFHAKHVHGRRANQARSWLASFSTISLRRANKNIEPTARNSRRFDAC